MSAARLSCVAGIDIGGSFTKLALVSRTGLVPETITTIPTQAHGDPGDFLDSLVEVVQDRQGHGAVIHGVGVAVPGLLTADHESVALCPNTPMLVGYPWRRLLAERLGARVELEVDTNAAGFGEYYFGAGRGIDRLMVLSVGTGIGGCMLIQGVPLRFAGGCCGDIGHTFVGGEARCSAGCTGCLESEVSVASMGGSAATVRELIRSAVRGDERARATIRRAGRSIGIALATLTACFQPQLVLLAGGIAEAGDLLTEPAALGLQEYGAPYFAVPVRKAALGGHAAVAGSAVSVAIALGGALPVINALHDFLIAIEARPFDSLLQTIGVEAGSYLIKRYSRRIASSFADRVSTLARSSSTCCRVGKPRFSIAAATFSSATSAPRPTLPARSFSRTETSPTASLTSRLAFLPRSRTDGSTWRPLRTRAPTRRPVCSPTTARSPRPAYHTSSARCFEAPALASFG